MLQFLAAFSIVLAFVASTAYQSPAQNPARVSPTAAEQEIIELEKKWNAAIQRRDAEQMKQFLAADYFLAVGVQGMPLEIVPRERWLYNLERYRIQEMSIDDIKVTVHGDTAVALMMYTQKATIGASQVERSAQFVLTDIWVKQKDGWRVAQRHSSRPEPTGPPAPAPAPTTTPSAATTSRPTVKVSDAVLTLYVGEYRMPSGAVLTITLENGSLFAQLTGQPQVEVYPESETKFFYKVVDAQITFTRGADGKVTGLTLHQSGRNQQVPKIK